jgi:hypothetical protein
MDALFVNLFMRSLLRTGAAGFRVLVFGIPVARCLWGRGRVGAGGGVGIRGGSAVAGCWAE